MAERKRKSSDSSKLEIAANSSKMISKNKLKAFNIGAMNQHKVVAKKEQEEHKKKYEEEALADVYQDFVSSFEDTSKGINRSWVKGGVVNPGAGEREGKGAEKNKIYKPTSKLAELAQSFSSYKDTPKSSPSTPQSKAKDEKLRSEASKRKSNLELFKEELKNIQEERQERRKVKAALGLSSSSDRRSRFDPSDVEVAVGSTLGLGPMDEYKGSMAYSDDASTTNIYLGNINPNMTEVQLCEIFGRYGPLASIKIMWPRSEEERARGRNCGFVAFMNRKDGERALNALQSKDIMGFEMKLGWGKAVPIPPHPVYIPPKLAELTQPPPPSGLPFNAQPKRSGLGKFNDLAMKNLRSFNEARKQNNTSQRSSFSAIPPPGGSGDESSQNSSDGGPGMPCIQPVRPPQHDPDALKEFEKTLKEAVIKVVIPTERQLLCLIHRMVEFVVREGPMFEAMIMNREMGNPQFRFLFDNHCPAHVYYRWKLFSVLQGESPFKWRIDLFKMFKGGSLWQPPPINPYTQGMPEHLIEKDSAEIEMERRIKEREREREEDQVRKGQLSESQRDRFEDMLRDLTPERSKIGDTMVWCLEHADAAEEIVECVTESLSILQTPLAKKLARLYLVSDILHNCSAKVPHASYYRKYFENKLHDIFTDLHDYYENIEGRLKAEQFKQRVMACFRAWEDWNVYPSDYLIKLQNVFLGLTAVKAESMEEKSGDTLSEVDGVPLDELDGEPLDGSKLRALGGPLISDLDGEPLTEDLDGIPLEAKHTAVRENMLEKTSDKPAVDNSKFVRSKWETVDEATVAAQAVTTSKWDMFEQYGDDINDDGSDDEDLDGKPLDDDLDGVPLETSGKLPLSQYDSPADSPEPQSRMTEERRAKLREIELKVVKYHDELEAGKRSRKPDLSISEQVEQYRKKLLTKEEEKDKEREREKQRESERDRVKEWEKAREKERRRDKERSDTPGSRNRRRSRSPSSPHEDVGGSKTSLSLLQRYGGSTSRSPSPGSTRSSRRQKSRSVSPAETSRKRSRKSPSRSPKRKRSRSRSIKRSKRSRSKSPKRHKKHKRRD